MESFFGKIRYYLKAIKVDRTMTIGQNIRVVKRLKQNKRFMIFKQSDKIDFTIHAAPRKA